MFRFKKPHIPDFKKVVVVILKSFATRVEEKVEAYAREHARRFQERIRRQDFKSFKAIPLSPVTIAKKKAAGVDLRTMIATKTYINSIGVHHKTYRKERRKVWRIGFNPRKLAVDYYGNKTDITLEEVARIQEHGSHTANIPARPHWRPHALLMRREAEARRRRWKLQAIRDVKKEMKRVLR